MLQSSLHPRRLSAPARLSPAPLCGGGGDESDGPGEPGSPAGAKPAGTAAPGAPPRTQRLRAVVVEDEFIILMQIESLLTAAGVEVVGTAVDADEALRLAERERPDFMTMDINLPRGGDGVDAARQIQERFGIRSVFISAYADARTRTRAEAAAPLGWLAKPITQVQLDRMLDIVRGQLGKG